MGRSCTSGAGWVEGSEDWRVPFQIDAAPRKPTPDGMAAETREESHAIGPPMKAYLRTGWDVTGSDRIGSDQTGPDRTEQNPEPDPDPDPDPDPEPDPEPEPEPEPDGVGRGGDSGAAG